MAAPPADVQVALTILQAVGLLIPVVFLGLRPFFTSETRETREVSLESATEDDSGPSRRIFLKFDDAPRVVRIALPVVGVLALAGILAGVHVFLWALGSWLLAAAAACLVMGIVGLGAVFYSIRQEFVSEPEGV